MGHIITWDNDEKTVVLQQYTEGASKDDLYMLAKKSNEMITSVSHRVHLIIDERMIDLVLNSADMKYLERLTPDNQGAVVMVVSKVKIPYKSLVQNFGKNVAPNAFEEPYFAESIDAARQFLQDNFQVAYAETSN